MDKLTDIPVVNETQPSQQEAEVMKKYFGDAEVTSTKPSWASAFKLALYVCLLFLALSNPITDGIFCHLPYCGEGFATLMGMKLLIFFVVFVAVYKFL